MAPAEDKDNVGATVPTGTAPLDSTTDSTDSTDPADDPASDPEKPSSPAPHPPWTRARLNTSVVRKYDVRLMPFAFFGLLLFWIDNASLGPARIAGLARDLHLRDAQFNIAHVMFVVGFAAFSVPGNLMVQRAGGRWWLPTMVCAWGGATIAGAFVTGFYTLCVTRLLLGMAEAGFAGPMLLYLRSFYTGDELTARVGIVFASTPLSIPIGGLLSVGLARIRRPEQDPWSWFFLVQGISTALLGICAFPVLTNSPATASFLTCDERKLAVLRMRAQERQQRPELQTRPGVLFPRYQRPKTTLEMVGDMEEHPTVAEAPRDRLRLATFRQAILHPLTLLATLGAFFTICALRSYPFFLPTIITSLGYGGEQDNNNDNNNNLQTTLMAIPPNATGAVFCIAVTQWSQRTRTFALPLLASATLASIGYIFLLVGSHVGQGLFDAMIYGGRPPVVGDPSKQVLPVVQYTGALFVAMGVNALAPLGLAWIVLTTGPYYIRAVTLGFVIAVGSLGGIVTLFVYPEASGPRYMAGHSVNLAFCLGTIAAGVVIAVWMRGEDKKRGRHNGLRPEQHELQPGWGHPHFQFRG